MGTWTRIAIFISWICAAISDEMVMKLFSWLFRIDNFPYRNFCYDFF